MQDYEYAKKTAEKCDGSKYNIIYIKVLDYIVPIAFQSSIALITDLEGVLINNIYNSKPEYRIKSNNVCIFPLKDTSVVQKIKGKNLYKL